MKERRDVGLDMSKLSSIMIVGCPDSDVNNIMHGLEAKRVKRCSSGEEAINELDRIQPDIIFMDVVLEGMTGLEATRWIKEHQPDVKIIMVSRKLNRAIMETGMEVGVDGYLEVDACQHIITKAAQTVLSGQSWFAYALSYLSWKDSYSLAS